MNAKNVFQMYCENGHAPGFWIQRDSWWGTVAKVTEVGPLKGNPPYYGNPKVRADIYDLTTGALKEANALIRSPGTFGYRMIDPPSWAGAPTD